MPFVHIGSVKVCPVIPRHTILLSIPPLKEPHLLPWTDSPLCAVYPVEVAPFIKAVSDKSEMLVAMPPVSLARSL
jgi:hypothetical protein